MTPNLTRTQAESQCGEKAGLGLRGVDTVGPTVPPRGCQGCCKRLSLLSSGRMEA